jgi:hypothetical protein
MKYHSSLAKKQYGKTGAGYFPSARSGRDPQNDFAIIK